MAEIKYKGKKWKRVAREQRHTPASYDSIQNLKKRNNSYMSFLEEIYKHVAMQSKKSKMDHRDKANKDNYLTAETGTQSHRQQ